MENIEQTEAVNSRNKSILVLAGAGSGKTKTLIDKVKFYINELKIAPKNILVITFTRHAVHEIQDRLIEYTDKTGTYKKALAAGNHETVRNDYIQKNGVLKNITVCTFHSLCYSILRKNGAPHLDNRFRLLGDRNDSFDMDESIDLASSTETIDTLLRKSVKSACEGSADFFRKLEQYLMENAFGKHLGVSNEEKVYINKEYRCLNGVIVKSKSEQRIADWFHCKGYEVEYEPLEIGAGFKFKPDFKLSKKEFYIEHKSNLSSDLTEKLKALRAAGKPCFITHEVWMHDSEKIEKELMNILANVLDGNYTANFSREFDNRFRMLDGELKAFFKDVKQLYDLMKSQNLNIADITQIKSDLFKHQRIKTFYELFPDVCYHYEFLKKKNSVIDFNDMLSQSSEMLSTDDNIMKYYQDKFRCILVDEFQDVNAAQVQLIKYLLSEKAYLFCVGDDWQSIYGFRGSDIRFIMNFSWHFPGAAVMKLKYNFRSTESIVNVGNVIIANNTNKIDKEVLSLKKNDQKVILLKSNSDEDILQFIKEKIAFHLQEQEDIHPGDIMILGRRSSHFFAIKEALKHSGIRFSTIHGAKGLEAKVVFITGLKHGSGGFPDTWLADSIYQVVKETNKEILLEEERRLFYVAITRAKDFLYLLSENGNESQFIDELPPEFIDEIIPLF